MVHFCNETNVIYISLGLFEDVPWECLVRQPVWNKVTMVWGRCSANQLVQMRDRPVFQTRTYSMKSLVHMSHKWRRSILWKHSLLCDHTAIKETVRQTDMNVPEFRSKMAGVIHGNICFGERWRQERLYLINPWKNFACLHICEGSVVQVIVTGYDESKGKNGPMDPLLFFSYQHL